MIGKESEPYYRGSLLFGEEPNWDALACSIRLLKYQEFILKPERAYKDESGEYWLPFTARISSRCNSAKVLADELEDYFGCVVELVHLTTGLAYPENLAAIEALGPGGRHFLLSDESTPTAGDIRPASAAVHLENADPFEALDSLVGLTDAKRQIHEIAQLLAKRGKESLPCLHMVFRGNPGTGKTTVARIIGDIFSEIGVVSDKGKFIETDRVGLVGQYVGHTAAKTTKCIESAQGGILFIDEAYALGMYAPDLGAGPEGVSGRRDFGPEALSTLVKAMEDNRDGFICIMAGYTDLMDLMINVNPGLRDRVGFYIDFPDYSVEELCEIFCSFTSKSGYVVDREAGVRLRGYIESLVASKDKEFSNARIVRKIFERVRMKQALTRDDDVITAECIDAAFDDGDLEKLVNKGVTAVRFGFCA